MNAILTSTLIKGKLNDINPLPFSFLNRHSKLSFKIIRTLPFIHIKKCKECFERSVCFSESHFFGYR